MDLVNRQSDNLYPFFAVDPRRPGVVKSVLQGRLVSNAGPFYGVKLYPRLGYHPMCAELMPIYEFCSKNDIPITTHCGTGGFPPSKDWRFWDMGNPENFRGILQVYENLRIDFAHFGHFDPDWANSIVDLMQYPYVYTDLSCYTDIEEIKKVYNAFWAKDLFRERCMFGTDFDIMYETGIITLQKYFANFKEIFTPEELFSLRSTNPCRFINVEIGETVVG